MSVLLLAIGKPSTVPCTCGRALFIPATLHLPNAITYAPALINTPRLTKPARHANGYERGRAIGLRQGLSEERPIIWRNQ